MPVKKKIKIRAMRGARAVRASTKKPSNKQIVNIYTSQPERVDFRQQMGYIPPFAQSVANPFQPVFQQLPSVKPPVQTQEEIRALRQEHFVEPIAPFETQPIVESQENIPFARRRNAGESDEEYAARIQKYEAMLARKRERERLQRQKANAPVLEAEVVAEAIPEGGGKYGGAKFM